MKTFILSFITLVIFSIPCYSQTFKCIGQDTVIKVNHKSQIFIDISELTKNKFLTGRYYIHTLDDESIDRSPFFDIYNDKDVICINNLGVAFEKNIRYNLIIHSYDKGEYEFVTSIVFITTE
jgi:hypothetical protein